MLHAFFVHHYQFGLRFCLGQYGGYNKFNRPQPDQYRPVPKANQQFYQYQQNNRNQQQQYQRNNQYQQQQNQQNYQQQGRNQQNQQRQSYQQFNQQPYQSSNQQSYQQQQQQQPQPFQKRYQYNFPQSGSYSYKYSSSQSTFTGSGGRRRRSLNHLSSHVQIRHNMSTGDLILKLAPVLASLNGTARYSIEKGDESLFKVEHHQNTMYLRARKTLARGEFHEIWLKPKSKKTKKVKKMEAKEPEAKLNEGNDKVGRKEIDNGKKKRKAGKKRKVSKRLLGVRESMRFILKLKIEVV